MGVETHPRHQQEQSPVGDPGMNGPHRSVGDHGGHRTGAARHVDLGRQHIGRTERNDGQRDGAAAQAVGHLVDGAVAAGNDQGIPGFRIGGLGEGARVAGTGRRPFGHRATDHLQMMQDVRQETFPATARGGVVDDEYPLSLRHYMTVSFQNHNRRIKYYEMVFTR